MNVLLPILAGSLSPGYCFPASPQQLLNDFADNLQAVLPGGMAFYNYGNTVPAVEFQAYPWLFTNDMRWYRFDGVWISPNPEISGTGIRRLWRDSLANLVTYDGGAAGAVTDRSGPMWEEDTTGTAGRSPMHPGAIPTSNPATVLAPADPTGATSFTGEGAHTMTGQEVGPHTHPLAADADIMNADGSIKVVTPGVTGPGLGKDLTSNNTTPLSVSNNTYTAGQQAMPVIHPVVGVYLIRRTNRTFYTAP